MRQLFALNVVANVAALTLVGGVRLYTRHKIRQVAARRVAQEEGL